MLNRIDNVAIAEGDLFEPAGDLRFDLIVSNPPFVVSPRQRAGLSRQRPARRRDLRADPPRRSRSPRRRGLRPGHLQLGPDRRPGLARAARGVVRRLGVRCLDHPLGVHRARRLRPELAAPGRPRRDAGSVRRRIRRAGWTITTSSGSRRSISGSSPCGGARAERNWMRVDTDRDPDHCRRRRASWPDSPRTT